MAEPLRPANSNRKPRMTVLGTVRKLTRRESEVADLLSRTDLKQADIAKQIGMSYKTLTVHVTNLYSKLGIHRRVELIKTRPAEGNS